jgi:hypothetical protein
MRTVNSTAQRVHRMPLLPGFMLDLNRVLAAGGTQ